MSDETARARPPGGDFLPEVLTFIQAARHARGPDREAKWKRAEDFVRRLIEADAPAAACAGRPWVHTYSHGERGE